MFKRWNQLLSCFFFLFDGKYYACVFIQRLLGTPTEEVWPGVSSLRDWHEYPKWKPQNLARVVPSLSPEGVDLLSVSCIIMSTSFAILPKTYSLELHTWFNCMWICVFNEVEYHVVEQKMLQYDPANRISAKDALDHPYFDSLDKMQFWNNVICGSSCFDMVVFCISTYTFVEEGH